MMLAKLKSYFEDASRTAWKEQTGKAAADIGERSNSGM